MLADRLIDETELVVKALGAPLTRVRHVTGAAILGTGVVVVILNPTDLVKSALRNLETTQRPGTLEDVAPDSPAESARRRVLVVDGLATRTLERSILEPRVRGCRRRNGVQALEVWNAKPGRDRLDETAHGRIRVDRGVRQDERWRNLPIVLVTRSTRLPRRTGAAVAMRTS